MTSQDLRTFREIWLTDFEFLTPPGELPVPICMVAREFRTGRTIRLWRDDLATRRAAPFAADDSALLVAYFASAELGCFLSLKWPLPERVLDLYAEFRTATNGRDPPSKASLLGALCWFGLAGLEVATKDAMRELILGGGPWTTDERSAILKYCETDVDALALLFARMQPHIDLPRALLRGRYTRAVARMEAVGVPIDGAGLDLLRASWAGVQDELIRRMDHEFGVYEGRTFRAARFADWLRRNGLRWPQLPSGALALDDEIFKAMALIYPSIQPLRELRQALSLLHLLGLSVGRDWRNRALLSPFSSRTGRNQPSTSKFIFGQPSWVRGLIRPEPGYGLAYVDWCQQEFGIAAYLSDDTSMIEAYQSRDPYLAFAKQARAVPRDATKASHGPIRERFKACALAVQYGMEAKSLAARTAQSVAQAAELLRLHHEMYSTFWRWSEAVLDYAALHRTLFTAFGWPIHVGASANPRSLRNFPMQANGAEMLRLACCLATERGIRVCAPIHDAVLVEAPIDLLDTAVYETQAAMAEASAIVLGGRPLRSEAKVFRFPERFESERGAAMWDLVWELIREAGSAETKAG